MDIAGKVRSFITTNFYVVDAASLHDDTSLLDRGIVDSTGVLEVIAFLETEFGIRIADEEMLPENLDSISRIGAFIQRKTN
jgi:acyl carrier protein